MTTAERDRARRAARGEEWADAVAGLAKAAPPRLTSAQLTVLRRSLTTLTRQRRAS